MEGTGNDDICVDCSDDEKYDIKLKVSGFVNIWFNIWLYLTFRGDFKENKWLPPPEEVIRLYEAIESQEYLELEWQCPGRRPPTPTETSHSNPSSDDNVDEE